MGRTGARPFEQKDADRPVAQDASDGVPHHPRAGPHLARRRRPVVIDQVAPQQPLPDTSTPTVTAPARLATVRPLQRVVPETGGHVTVRVVGFDERLRATPPGCDGLGRLSVRLVRDADHAVRVLDLAGDELGTLPEPWNLHVERELARCEADGVEAVARATLTGPRDARDLCVLLGWPGGRRHAF